MGYYCNASCKHCYSSLVRKNKNILTADGIYIIIEKLHNLGVETINLGGNEPIFTNGPDPRQSQLPLLIKLAVSVGIKVGITTNGTTALFLADNFPDVFQLVNDWDFSLDSPFEREHNNHRGNGFYKKVLKGLQICESFGVPKCIVICAMNWNISAIHANGFLKLAEKYKSEIRVNILRPVSSMQLSMMPDREALYYFFKLLMEKSTTLVLNESIFAGISGIPVFGCSCGTSSMRINPKNSDGVISVTPCIYLNHLNTGDMLQDNIFDIVNSPEFKLIRERNRKIPSECLSLNCEWKEICRGGCTARAYLINGDLNRADPYCPKLMQIEGYEIPTLRIKHRKLINQIRVHENYLCTWIGVPESQQMKE